MIRVLRHLLADRQQPSGRALLIQCVVAVLLTAAADQVYAACGDYVMVGGEHSVKHAISPGNNVPSLPGAHCDGPNCHRHVPPVNRSRQVLKTPSTDRACVPGVLDIPSSPRSWTVRPASLRPLSGYRRDIEHPPRPAI